MEQTQPQNAKTNVLLALFACALVGLAVVFVAKEMIATLQRSTTSPAATEIAQANLKLVNDPGKGWFPYQRDPIYGWETDLDSWQLEDGIGGPPQSKDIPKAPAAPTKKGAEPTADEATPVTAAAGKDSRALRNVSGGNEGQSALEIPVNFPDPATVLRDIRPGAPNRFVGVRFVAYDVFVPRECPGFVGCLFFMKDKDGLWYQARSRAALIPGQWTTVTADIRGDSPDVTPLGHLGQWDDNQATQIRTVGITFYGDRPWSGEVKLDNFRGWMRGERFKQMVNSINGEGGTAAPVTPDRTKVLQALVSKTGIYTDPPIQLINLRTLPAEQSSDKGLDPPTVGKFQTLTVRFELNRQVENPFDPDKADITCLVQKKDGTGPALEHVGFWFQEYDRTERFTEEELRPMGRPEWRVRITPREEGAYTYKLKIRLKKSGTFAENTPDEEKYDTLLLAPRTFICTPSEDRGFIRVSKSDSRFFEFENNEFFYPVGHNLHSPVDLRCWEIVFKEPPPAGRGLPMYHDYFDKMKRNGENTAEIWMASWWLGIEWTSRWRDFYGVGRYSLQKAWKLDYVLNLARENGIYVHIVLDNHGKFSAWCDWEWDNNPNNAQSSGDQGAAANAEEFFTNETSRRQHRNKLRYIAARWGADPTIMGWELVSEYDLVGGTHQRDQRRRRRYPEGFHCSPTLQNWAKEMSTQLRQYDVYNHPVTNHYATDYMWIDQALMRSQFFDYVCTDVYRPVIKSYMRSALDQQAWSLTHLAPVAVPVLPPQNNPVAARDMDLIPSGEKPYWITEYGGDFNAGAPNALHGDVHAGLWATWVTNGAGTPLFWWYDFIDRHNLYTYYGAFSNYIKGEDRRGIRGNTEQLALSGPGAPGLVCQAYRWNRGAYVWAFNEEIMRMLPFASSGSGAKHEGVTAQMIGLEAGQYVVEYWDCYTGKIVHSQTKTMVAGQPMALEFPLFHNDMAAKVKAVGATTPAPAAAITAPPLPVIAPPKVVVPGPPKKTRLIAPDAPGTPARPPAVPVPEAKPADK